MAFDLRDYIEILKRDGELKEIDAEVDWNLEAPAIATMAYRVPGSPALLFNKMRGYPEGYRMVSGLYAGTMEKPWRRMCKAVGIDPDVNLPDMINELAARVNSSLKPVEVDTGPCKEIIRMGKEVNLYDFPFPYCHEGDGGRYSCIHTVICQDPDTGWTNWGNYRMIMHTRNRVAIYLSTGQQARAIYHVKFELRGKSMPMCIAIGGDPVNFFVSGMALPEGVDEVDCAGGLRKAPIELVKAETNNILVPANAEIVLEGEMRPYERLDEGPFGEYPLFHHGPRKPGFAFRVNCITHRKDPIIPFLTAARISDSISMYSVLFTVAFYNTLVYANNLPVKMVYFAPHSPNQTFFISTDVPYKGFIRNVADCINSKGQMTHYDYIYFVDSEVDPSDVEQVIEEIMTKTNPLRDYHISDNVAPKLLLAGYLDEEDFQKNVLGESGLGAKDYIDATTKGNPEIKRNTFETLFPEDLQKWVVENWKRLGFEEGAKWNKPYMEKKAMVEL